MSLPPLFSSSLQSRLTNFGLIYLLFQKKNRCAQNTDSKATILRKGNTIQSSHSLSVSHPSQPLIDGGKSPDQKSKRRRVIGFSRILVIAFAHYPPPPPPDANKLIILKPLITHSSPSPRVHAILRPSHDITGGVTLATTRKKKQIKSVTKQRKKPNFFSVFLLFLYYLFPPPSLISSTLWICFCFAFTKPPKKKYKTKQTNKLSCGSHSGIGTGVAKVHLRV